MGWVVASCSRKKNSSESGSHPTAYGDTAQANTLGPERGAVSTKEGTRRAWWGGARSSSLFWWVGVEGLAAGVGNWMAVGGGGGAMGDGDANENMVLAGQHSGGEGGSSTVSRPRWDDVFKN